ncbi:MAG: hypothetical protein NW201_07990 [Gemmatimonadales bacterium]|nr:hypothetical protein [Gemmatimonadales bacterium]
MTHLTMEQLLAVREPDTAPGSAAARAHLAACDECRAELARLEQRVARLRALPTLVPGRDRWPAVRAQVQAERRWHRARWAGAAVGALAAAWIAAVVLRPPAPAPVVTPGDEIAAARARSAALEATLQELQPEVRVLDGRTARIAAELEERIAGVDRTLQAVELQRVEPRDARLAELWRERVGLMDALVDVHVTRAGRVGL